MRLNAFSRIARATCALALSVAIALQGIPVQALAAEQNTQAAAVTTETGDGEANFAKEPWHTYIDVMLSAGTYVEGSALAAVSRDMKANDIEASNTNYQVEELYKTTGDQYELAFGLGLSDEIMQATSDALGEDVDLVTAEDVVVKILLVKCDSMTTRELLEALAKDSRVIGATPDYLFNRIDDPKSSTDEQPTGTDEVPQDDETDAQDQAGETDDVVDGADDADAAADADIDLLSGDSTARAATQASAFTPAAAPTNVTATSGVTATSLQWGFDLKTLCFKGSGNSASLNEATFNSGSVNSGGVVAVFDTGVDYNHPDLKDSFFDMTPYLAKTGGGKYGYDAVDDDSTNPMDTLGHGTHVAGILAAQNNAYGVSGIANGAKIIAVKAAGKNTTNGKDSTDTIFSASAIYAGYSYLTKVVQAGVDLRAINCSWNAANSTTQASVRLAITDLANKYGVVTVFASGNAATNLDSKGADSTMSILDSSILTVDSTNVDGSASAFSNYGKTTTTVFAPGGGILSTIKTSSHTQYLPTVMNHTTYETFTGTSALKTQGPTGDALTTTVNSAAGFDSQGGCMSLDTSQLNAAASSNSFNGAKTRVILSVPLGDTDPTQLSEVGLAVNLVGKTASTAWLEVAGANNKWLGDTGTQTAIDSGSWICLSLNLYEAAQTNGCGGIKIYRDNSGKAYIKVAICLGADTFLDGSSLKIDAVGLGNQCWSYGYMSGTSMSTPAITGLLAVYSYRMGTEYSGLSKTVRAKKLANILRKTTVTKDALSQLCATGGYPDASKLAAAVAADKNTAYVGSASYAVDKADSSYALCTISGIGFGDEQGAAEIAGLSEGTLVEVVGWSDDTVQLRVARSQTATQLSATVTTTGGTAVKTGAISVLDTISQDGGSGSGSGSGEQGSGDGAKQAGEKTARSAGRGGTPATGDETGAPVFALAVAGTGALLATTAVASGRVSRHREGRR